MTVVQAHRFLRKLKNTGSASALGTLAYLEPSSQYFDWHKLHLFLCGYTAHRGGSLSSCLWGILFSLQHLITTKIWRSVGAVRMRVAFKSLVQLTHNQNLHVWSSSQHMSSLISATVIWMPVMCFSTIGLNRELSWAGPGSRSWRWHAVCRGSFSLFRKCSLMYLALP